MCSTLGDQFAVFNERVGGKNQWIFLDYDQVLIWTISKIDAKVV